MLDWDKAEKHLYDVERAYEEIGLTGMFGLGFIYPLIERFENGERTQEFYNEIMGLE